MWKQLGNFISPFCAVHQRFAAGRTFGAPDMASSDLVLTDSASDTAGSRFCPGSGPAPGMDSGGTSAAVAITGWMMRHLLFDGTSPYHCVSSSCVTTVPPSHLDAMVGIIFW